MALLYFQPEADGGGLAQACPIRMVCRINALAVGLSSGLPEVDPCVAFL